MAERYDLIVVGTGFASSFFLKKALESRGPSFRVLVLERGAHRTHAWQLAHRAELEKSSRALFRNRTPRKTWWPLICFGGASNAWFGVTPRFLPEDFRLHALYGRGVDWPIGYDDLERYYTEAENIMAVAGPSERSPFPRSGPYPQPAHNMTDPEHLLARAHPDAFFSQPCARPRQATKNRPACCTSGVCSLCPIDSKFTVLNELATIYQDARVTLLLEAEARSVDLAGGRARGVIYAVRGVEQCALGDLVALGANALFNPFLLLRSGLTHPWLGAGLHEQVSVRVDVLLDGVDSFQGSTATTGHGYMLYRGERRKKKAAALLETWNVPVLRREPGRARQRMIVKAIFEDLPQDINRVFASPHDPDFPIVTFQRHSDYAMLAVRDLAQDIDGALRGLPIERIDVDRGVIESEGHILGTTRMGRDPRESVVDGDGVHHEVRNLVVLGGSLFPTGSPANPTLTISALALRSADRLFGRA
ncbi:MAG: GMC family oxidoreductase [Acidobacteria bacterium]|nr:GMC family oxidoreductase [Acidobacteriota bacterium]